MRLDPIDALAARAREHLADASGLRGVAKALVHQHVSHSARGALFTVKQHQRKPAIIFASGSNGVGDIRGFSSRAGIHVGVAAPDLSENAIEELENLAGTGTKVFLDSGAFSEVEERPDGPPAVVKPITDTEWEKRLAIYRRLGHKLRSQLYVVAPDLVGNQEQTLARMTRYAGHMQELHRLGVHVLAPIQFGAETPTAFYWKASWALGFLPVPSFPLKKAALWTPEDVARFAGEVKPTEIHLLGLGAKNKRSEDYLAAIHGASPTTQVSQDSNLIAGAVGRAKVTGEATRPLTAAQDAVQDEQLEGWNREIEDPEFGAAGDYTEEISTPSAWLGRSGLQKVAAAAGLDESLARAWYRDPDGFLQELHNDEDAWHEHPLMAQALENAWIHERHLRLTPARKTEAIGRAFADHPAAGQIKKKRPKGTAA